MKPYRISRRDALLAGAAATLPLALRNAQAAGKAPAIGVSTLGFGALTNAELAKEFKAQEVNLIQFFLTQKDSKYWVYNGRADLSTLSMDQCKEIAATYRAEGIEIHSIGVYTNLIHPDATERAANLAYFEDMMKVGAAMGVDTFITESGHYEPEGPAHRTVYHFQEKVWYQMVETGKELAKIAERNNAKVLLEGYFGSFFASAKRIRCFIEEVDSPRIRCLLDPANLLELNDLEEMFTQLAPYIDCLHAKDRKLHVESGVAAGQGDIDYAKFIELGMKHTPDVPFIFEYVGMDNYKQAMAHFRKNM